MYTLQQVLNAIDIYELYKNQYFNKYSALVIFIEKYFSDKQLRELLNSFNIRHEKNDSRDMLAEELSKVIYDIVELFYDKRNLLHRENFDIELFQNLMAIHRCAKNVATKTFALMSDIQHNTQNLDTATLPKEILALAETLLQTAQKIHRN